MVILPPDPTAAPFPDPPKFTPPMVTPAPPIPSVCRGDSGGGDGGGGSGDNPFGPSKSSSTSNRRRNDMIRIIIQGKQEWHERASRCPTTSCPSNPLTT